MYAVGPPDATTGVGPGPQQLLSGGMSLQPNPTSRGARIWLGPGSVAGASRVEIFDVRGRLVRRLPLNEAGAVIWDGRDEGGLDVPPGVHLVRSIRADGSSIAVKRLVVVR
jgi:hypothetical protein